MSQHKEQSGIDIRAVWSSTAYYVVAYTVDRTKQILLSLDNYTEEAWHTLLESAGERLDELFNPGPEPVDKIAPGKAVEIYMLLPWAKLSKQTIKEFYEMVNGRVVFRIKNQAHIPHQDPPLVHGSEFLIQGAPNPSISVGARPLNLSLIAFYEWPQ
jgi:hypothetical protein